VVIKEGQKKLGGKKETSTKEQKYGIEVVSGEEKPERRLKRNEKGVNPLDILVYLLQQGRI